MESHSGMILMGKPKNSKKNLRQPLVIQHFSLQENELVSDSTAFVS
jgi:hypothetical protein